MNIPPLSWKTNKSAQPRSKPSSDTVVRECRAGHRLRGLDWMREHVHAVRVQRQTAIARLIWISTRLEYPYLAWHTLGTRTVYPCSHVGSSPAGGSSITRTLSMSLWPETSARAAAGGSAVEVQHADRAAARRRAAHGHLGDVHAVVAEDRAHRADDARHVVVREHQQHAVEIGLQPRVAQANQPRHVVAEQRAAGFELLAAAAHFARPSTS